MAQIFAMLKSPQSVFKAIGLPNGTTPTSSVIVGSSLNDNSNKFVYIGGGFNIKQTGPAPIKISCPSKKLYVKLMCGGWLHDSSEATSYSPRGQIHRLLKFLGDDGLCKFSFGHKPGEYADTAVGYNDMRTYDRIKSATFRLFSFAGANEYRPSAESAGYLMCPSAIGTAVYVEDTIEIKVDLETLGARSVVMLVNGYKVAELTDAQLPAGLTAISSIAMLDPAEIKTSSVVGYMCSSHIKSMLVADTDSFGLKVESLVPTAFGAVNDFTGALANITSPIQDSLYISTSAEIGQAVDLLFSFPQDLLILDKMDVYFQGKYVQELGVSAKFSIVLVDKTTGTLLTTPQIVTVPANVSDNVYSTDLVASWVTNIVTSQKFTAAELANSAVKISLIGV